MTVDSRKDWIRDVFDRTATTYGDKGCHYFDEFGKQLISLVQLNPGEKILDVATGKGAILFPATKIIGKMGTSIGIDLSPAMIEESRKRNQESSAQLHVMNAENLTFPPHSFDVVFCGFALFFFPKLSTALDEFKRVLKNDGRLGVSVWGRPSSLTRWVGNRAEQLGAVKQLKMQNIDSAAITITLKAKKFSKNGTQFCNKEIDETQNVIRKIKEFVFHKPPEAPEMHAIERPLYHAEHRHDGQNCLCARLLPLVMASLMQDEPSSISARRVVIPLGDCIVS